MQSTSSLNCDTQRRENTSFVICGNFSVRPFFSLNYFFTEHLNAKFVNFLFDTVESPPANDEVEALPDTFVKLILAFNLHFEMPDENIVMQALAERGTAKTFTEKLLLLFNREGIFRVRAT